MTKSIYLDYAAATPLDPRVLKAMQPYFSKLYANPSSLHAQGREAKKTVDAARSTVAAILHAKPEEIIFTSGGTESINLAIKGATFQKGKGHIITSSIEHPAALETCKFLETQGFSVTYLDVDRFGLVSPKKVEKAIRHDTILITIMYANNEIGTIQPIKEIGRIAQRHNIPFHCDACQAGMQDLNINYLNVDLLTLNGSKIYGPKESGILYKRSSLQLVPLLHGGGQEFNFRSGTEPVASILGFATALELAQKNRAREHKHLAKLRDYFVAEILRKIPNTSLNGHPSKCLPGMCNISFSGVEAESLLRYLDQRHIHVSTGSACSSHQVEVSHVLRALGKTSGDSIRFSFGKDTTKEQLKKVIATVQEIVSSLRRL